MRFETLIYRKPSLCNSAKGLAGHSAEADETACEFDFTHMAESVLVKPALESVEHGDSFWSGDSSAVGGGDLWWEWSPNDQSSEISGVHGGEVRLGAIKDRSLVLLEGVEITDALMDHFVDSSFFAVVVDCHLHA
jgi:hypothetical protein